MPRRTFDAIMSSVGALLTVMLVVAGALLFWGHSFANNNVTEQLTAQKIFFPDADSLADPRIEPYLTKYAGRQLTTGAQAEAYANHYIAVHVSDVADGKTYAEMGALVQADPDNAELAAQRETIFKGETLRGLLLNAFAFWKVGQLALIGSIVSFALAALMGLLTVLGFLHLRRAPVDEEILAPVIHTAKRPA